VHQFVHIGAHAMIGFQAHVGQDVPPFMVAEGNPMALRAVNLTGLKRRDFSPERIATIRNMHKALYRKSQTLDLAKAEIEAMRGDDAGVNGDIDAMLDFIASGTRGLVR
jgi:UDP-N-acetylglucosamine acyltransferase